MIATIDADGETVRLDGVSNGAVLINHHVGDLYRLRMTDEEGGEFVHDAYYRGPLGERLKEAYWTVHAARKTPLPGWQKQFVWRAFA